MNKWRRDERVWPSNNPDKDKQAQYNQLNFSCGHPGNVASHLKYIRGGICIFSIRIFGTQLFDYFSRNVSQISSQCHDKGQHGQKSFRVIGIMNNRSLAKVPRDNKGQKIKRGCYKSKETFPALFLLRDFGAVQPFLGFRCRRAHFQSPIPVCRSAANSQSSTRIENF